MKRNELRKQKKAQRVAERKERRGGMVDKQPGERRRILNNSQRAEFRDIKRDKGRKAARQYKKGVADKRGMEMPAKSRRPVTRPSQAPQPARPIAGVPISTETFSYEQDRPINNGTNTASGMLPMEHLPMEHLPNYQPPQEIGHGKAIAQGIDQGYGQQAQQGSGYGTGQWNGMGGVDPSSGMPQQYLPYQPPGMAQWGQVQLPQRIEHGEATAQGVAQGVAQAYGQQAQPQQRPQSFMPEYVQSFHNSWNRGQQ